MNNPIKTIKESIKRHTFIEDSFGAMLMVMGYGNKYMVGINSMYKTYRKINRKYKHLIGQKSFKKSECEDKSNTIWLCWLQGIENAPRLVKCCYNSIKHHCNNEIIVITKDNYKRYTDLPPHIIDKWERGIITPTHFSDILRLNLLIRHGGLWLDATVYLTSPIPDYVTSDDFFVFRNGWFNDEMINMGSWLIYSKPNNILLRETENLIFKYWEKHNYLKNYFLLHIFFRMVSDHYHEQWSKVPYINHIDNHILAMEIDKKYDKKRFEQIRGITSVHKLSNKINLDNEAPDSFYSRLENLYKQD